MSLHDYRVPHDFVCGPPHVQSTEELCAQENRVLSSPPTASKSSFLSENTFLTTSTPPMGTGSSMPSVATALTTLAAATLALSPSHHGPPLRDVRRPRKNRTPILRALERRQAERRHLLQVRSQRASRARTGHPHPRGTTPPADDPRSQGYPCYGNHIPMAPGRGSLTGRNKFGIWARCETCRLRISYTPAFGATALRRQAGPLLADVNTTPKDLEPKKMKEDPMYREQLNPKSVGYKGAEESLHRRLKEIEDSKKKNPPRQRPGAAKDAQMPPTHASAAHSERDIEGKKAARREMRSDSGGERMGSGEVARGLTGQGMNASILENDATPDDDLLDYTIPDDEKGIGTRSGTLTPRQRDQLCLCAEEFIEEANMERSPTSRTGH